MPSGVPMPIGEIPGWHQTFTDDFTGDALGDQWFAYSGAPSGDPGGWFLPSHVSVGAGMLTVRGSKEQTPHGVLYATGGVSNHNVFSQMYGRFDVRFRMDKGVGIAYAILLWPTSQHWPPELDIIEDNGHDRQSTSATAHYDHDDKKIQRQTTGDFTKWHTATLEWTPRHLVYRLDGKVWATIDSPHVPDEPMDLALQTQAWGCGGTWEACPNSTTPPVVDLEVDWVSLYEWTGP
jgi:beta-glucanase (GH16 family)